MAPKFREIAFTPNVLALQAEAYGRSTPADAGGLVDRLGAMESEFLTQADSFYMATVSENGWPYMQHRGGAPGFLKVLSTSQVAFSDYPGNRQLISAGNLRSQAKACLFFMDYTNRRRLKLFGLVRCLSRDEAVSLPWGALVEKNAERVFLIDIEGWDWNCPKYIPARYSLDAVEEYVRDLKEENRRLVEEVHQLKGQAT